MKWATRALIHFDRVISAWLILRFVDEQAHFVFLEAEESADDDAIWFGVPGVQLGAHGEGMTTFQRILDTHAIGDPVLRRLGSIVADVVDHVMEDANVVALTQRGPYVGGLLAVAEGIMLVSSSDAECLSHSLVVYDALYARLQAQAESSLLAVTSSVTALTEATQLANAVRELRRQKVKFSPTQYGCALNAITSREGHQS